jgi:hypothetical protein
MKKKKKKAQPTAADRTLSLFTRRTDEEDPNARDGSKGDPYVDPSPKRRPRASGFKYKPGPTSDADRRR